MPPPTTCRAPPRRRKNSLVSTQCQSVSTSIKLYQVVCLFKVSKSRPFWVTLQKKERCLWLRSRIRAHNKLSEAGQRLGCKLGLFQYIYLLPCINPWALIGTISWIDESHTQAGSSYCHSPVRPAFGQNKISCHLSQEVTYPLQLALIEWESKARIALMSS